MERVLLKSKVIMELEERIKLRNDEALQEFWIKMEHEGGPIIERIEDDDKNSLVTFVFKAEKDIDNVVFVPKVGSVKFLENKMERLLETNVWYITCKVRNDVRFSYFFSPNDAFDNDLEKRWDNLVQDIFNNNAIVFEGDKGEKDIIMPYVVMPNAEEHFWVKERKDIQKGSLHELEFQSDKFKEGRRVRIYTPPTYNHSSKPYGYLVLTDGDEYINILSAVQVLDNLIGDKKIPPIVTIFIDSTENRMEELKCNDTFGDVIVKELIPWVKNNYNISDKAEEAIIGGLSLGGLTAAYLGLKHSEVFGNVLSQSGSYWYKPEDYKANDADYWMSNQFKAIDLLPLKFYLNIGILETKDRIVDTNINLRDTLISKGYKVDFEEFKSGHDYLCWGETLANGLISLIGI